MLTKFSFLIVILFSFSIYADETFIVSYDPWCPHTCEKGAKLEGVYIDAIKTIYTNSGFNPAFQQINWSRALEETRIGKSSAVAGALKADAPDFIFGKLSINNQHSCFYVKSNSKWSYKGVASLKSKKVGSVQNYTYGEPFDSATKAELKDVTDEISGEDTAMRLLQKLLLGRNEIIIEDESVVSYTIQKMKTAGIKEVDQIKNAGCLSAVPLFVAFSPKISNSKKLLEIWENGIQKLKNSGELDRIFKKYGLKTK